MPLPGAVSGPGELPACPCQELLVDLVYSRRHLPGAVSGPGLLRMGGRGPLWPPLRREAEAALRRLR